MPPRVLASGPKPCGGNNLLITRNSGNAESSLGESWCQAFLAESATTGDDNCKLQAK